MTARRCVVRGARTGLCAIAVAALAFSAAACGGSSVVSGVGDLGNAVPAKDFVGSWTSTVAQ
ncbi:MAG: hypothetical protein WCN81_15280, partial [Actinomycetes bacterium]